MTIDEAKKLVDSYARKIDYTRVVAVDDAYSIVTNIVAKMQLEIEKLTLENGQMSAKIFAYEAILQNSNFKMAVVRKKDDK